MERVLTFFREEPETAALVVALLVFVSVIVFLLSYVDPMPHYVARSVLQ